MLSIFKQCLAGKDRFLEEQISRYLQRRTNIAANNSTQNLPIFLSWKDGDLPPSSSKRLTGMSLYIINIDCPCIERNTKERKCLYKRNKTSKYIY